MAPVRSKSEEANSCVPKSLCELTNHLSCVNCVRWSHDGKWLASGGDDAIVMIWQIKHQGAALGGGGGFGSTTHEHWGCVHMLRGHSSDVLDLSWSPDRKYLASCSVDNSIVIWNAKQLPQKISVIGGHQGLVKGLTWDPVGKFIASQSDDHSIRIWRTSDWKEAKVITEPFQNCSGTTHVLRLSWSPDGKYIVSAHALNNEGPTAQIIERGAEWKMGMDFVGHRKAVEVVLFNPHLFVKSGSKENHGCVALGSKDRSLSVWLTNHKRPLAVIHDLFNDSILDLSWSDDGYELMVCSTDGSIAYLSFSSKELGLRLSKQALDDLYLRTYGFKRAEVKSSDSSMVLIENPDMLKFRESELNTSKISCSTDGRDESINIVSSSAKASTITEQVETRTKEGKRRITPITLATEPSSVTGAPLPFTSFSPKQNKGAVVVQISPERSDASKKSTSSSEHSTPKSCAEFPEGSTPPKPISFEALSPNTIQDPVTATKSLNCPSAKVTSTSKVIRKRPTENVPADVLILPKAKKLKKKGTQLSMIGALAVHSPKPSTPQKHSNLQSILKQASLAQLPAPRLESSISVLLLNMGGGEPEEFQEDSSPVVEIENNTDTLQYSLSFTRESVTVWKVELASPCLLAAANQNITSVACQDKSLSIFSTQSGRLLVGKLFLPDTCYALKVESRFLMALLCSSRLTVWDTQGMSVLVQDVPFGHLLQSGKQAQAPDKCLLTKDGLPVLKISSSCFIFNTDMRIWMELGNAKETSEIHKPEFNFPSKSQGDALSSSLDFLQKSLQSTSSRDDSVGLMLQQVRNTGVSQPSTLAYLESQISRCLCVRSPAEYKHWSKAYVQYLVKNNLESRLREFCGKFSVASGDFELVLGFDKMEMLREFLVIIAKNHKLQRLYSELKEAVDRT